jgi:hypothetical protein
MSKVGKGHQKQAMLGMKGLCKSCVIIVHVTFKELDASMVVPWETSQLADVAGDNAKDDRGWALLLQKSFNKPLT